MAESESVPDIVYHYTSIDTMMKIVESESIWATSVCYLNDTSEQSHFLNLVRKRLPSIAFRNSDDREAAVAFLSKPEGGFERRPFIASFSADGDSLPQWRSYCHEGNGVAIGFSTECLENAHIGDNEPLAAAMIRLAKVKYPSPKDEQEIDNDLLTLMDSANATVATLRSQGSDFKSLTLPLIFGFMLAQEACFRKSESFRSENEYRLLVDTILPSVSVLSYRVSRSSLIPYIDVKVPRYEDGHESDPSDVLLSNSLVGSYQFIKEITVGPSPNIELTVDTVRAFFKTKKLKVDVKKSDVSFRDW
jgi:DUF2971 family protein